MRTLYLVRRLIEGCRHKYGKWSDPIQTHDSGHKQQWRACTRCNKVQFRTLLWDKQTSIVAIQNALDKIKKESPAAAPVQDECVVCGDKVRVIPRQWVGLTDEEIDACDPHEECWGLHEAVRRAEAKLRELNGGQV